MTYCAGIKNLGRARHESASGIRSIRRRELAAAASRSHLGNDRGWAVLAAEYLIWRYGVNSAFAAQPLLALAG
jgi:hypothetical protein